MFKTFSNAFKVKDIRKRILLTLLLIVIYRLGCFIPIPGVNVELVAQAKALGISCEQLQRIIGRTYR